MVFRSPSYGSSMEAMTQTLIWSRSSQIRHSQSVRQHFGISQLPLTMTCRFLQFSYDAVVQFTCHPYTKTVVVPPESSWFQNAQYFYFPCYGGGTHYCLVSLFGVTLDPYWLIRTVSSPMSLGSNRYFWRVEFTSSSSSYRLRKSSSSAKAVKHDVQCFCFRYGIVMLFLDEARKWWNRGHPSSLLARIAW